MKKPKLEVKSDKSTDGANAITERHYVDSLKDKLVNYIYFPKPELMVPRGV